MGIAEPRRGEVWLADLDKLRPVVVLTRDPLGRHLHSVIVGPVTSKVRGLSTEVAVGSEDGVRADSVVNLDNLQLLERVRLHRKVGQVRAVTLRQICSAAAIAIGCDT
ncbi:MAG: type II toxin-antitoxin system PemK/MazF family toxin [Pseudonocardiaceae bacterium]